MPWETTGVVVQKNRFIDAWRSGISVARAAGMFRISRVTAHRVIRQYEEGGRAALRFGQWEWIGEWLRREPVAAIADRYGVSRTTVHEAVARFDVAGRAALGPRSRARKTQQRVRPEVKEALLELRCEHPTWGP